MDYRYDDEFDMPSQVIDLDHQVSLVRALYSSKMLRDQSIDVARLDTTFFDNSAINIGEFTSNIHLGQKLQFFIKEDVRPLDTFESTNLTYKDGIECGGQLDLDCSFPCGGITPTYRQDELVLDKQYAAMAQICAITEQFLPDKSETLMSRFNESFNNAKFGYALDVWNKAIETAIEAPYATKDTFIAQNADYATHLWDMTGKEDKEVLGAVIRAYQYLTSHFKGTFGVFVPQEFAAKASTVIAQSHFAQAVGISMPSLTYLADFHGVSSYNLPAQIGGGLKMNIIPRGEVYMKGNDNYHPLYARDNSEAYIVIAAKDAVVHYTIDGITRKSEGGCDEGAIDRITKLFYGGSKTIFPEKILVIKIDAGMLDTGLFDFCC